MVAVVEKEKLKDKNFVEGIKFQLVEKLREGKLICFGLENGYVILADPFNDEAVETLKSIKSLDNDYYFPLLVPSVASLTEIVTEITPSLRLIANNFWPGPLNIEVAARKGIPWNLGATVPPRNLMVRMPKNKILLSLLSLTGPLLFTSAGERGSPPSRSTTEIPIEIMNKLSFVIDTGPCPIKSKATTISFFNQTVRISREGVIKTVEIRKVLPTIFSE